MIFSSGLLSNFFVASYALINFSSFHASITKSPGEDDANDNDHDDDNDDHDDHDDHGDDHGDDDQLLLLSSQHHQELKSL